MTGSHPTHLDLALIACAAKPELIVALIGFSLALGWLLCALFVWWQEWWQESRNQEREQW